MIEGELNIKELRVGNFIYDAGIDFDNGGNKIRSDDTELVVVTVEVMASIIKYPFGNFNYHSYVPIPISPEWLERFNFEMDDDMEYGIIWSFKISDDASIYWNGFIEIEVRTKYVTTRYDLDHIKHIHQLQNLYHSLTGKELELKEKV
jgi:hypothetical protein